MSMIRYIKNNFLKNLGYALVGILIAGGWIAVVGICIYINTIVSYTVFAIWVILTLVLLFTILSYYEKKGKYKD